MIKKITILFLSLFPYLQFAQDYSDQWEGLFSYYNIKDVTLSTNKITAAAENAIFNYNTLTQERNKFSTINGLSGETISAVHYSEAYEISLIGYENGLMEIVFDNGDNTLSVVDILEKPTIQPSQKSINHFNEQGGIVYIATNYGISVFDLERLEFGDSYYIGDLGSHVKVNQTVIYQDYIYAACENSAGIKKAPVDNPNLIDYQEWTTAVAGNYKAVETLNDRLFVARTNKRFYELNTWLSQLAIYSNFILDVRVVEDKLIVTTKSETNIYDGDFNLITQINASENINGQFNCATFDSEYYYIGTSDIGLIKISFQDLETYQSLSPEGPLFNNAFSIEVNPTNLWVTFGDYDFAYNPYPLHTRGFSHLQNEEWINVSKDSVLTARNLNAIAINPLQENQVFISACIDGVLEVNDNTATVLYNASNSTLEPRVIGTNNFRQTAAAFSNEGVLWTTTGRSLKPLNSYDPTTGAWASHDFSGILQDVDDEWGYCDVIIDNSGNKWLGGLKKGLIGYNESNSADNKVRALYKEEENMPSTFVTAIALDKNNQMWIGTQRGIRVLRNTANFFSAAELHADEIIILENGVPSELLYEQFVSGIVVDGSNNKWISVVGSGLFYFSADAQETIFHFTTENSPLPSNNINNLELNESNGKLYVATEKGIVTFSAGGAAPTETISEAYVYPNPVRPTFNITQDKIKIKDISENVNIKITDIEGNLVAEAQSNTNTRYKGYNLEIDGGIALWNGKNLANNVVASGVYLVMLSDLDSLDTKVIKIMVVR
ncbi:MAG: two-component regulator propeller domain-containing protein [Oceanihabitans sp.]